MSSDTLLKDEEGKVWSLDNLCTGHYLRGHAPGMELAAGYLLERATEMFLSGETAKAELLRDVSRDMRTKLRQTLGDRVKKHDAEYPEVVEAPPKKSR